jgi:hypothetical protein
MPRASRKRSRELLNQPRKLLDSMMFNAVAQSGGTLVSADELEFASGPARHATFTVPGGAGVSSISSRAATPSLACS